MSGVEDAASIEASIKSRHSSIRGPYRKGMNDPDTFAYCHLIKNADMTPDQFSRSLLSAGHGFPIWNVKGNFNRPAEHLKNGVSIGDVIRMGRDGTYIFYFNIFHPSSHPIQGRYVPPNLEPFPESRESLVIHQASIPPGTVLASHGINVSTISTSPLEIHMTSSAREGAVIIFPEGALREDIAEPEKLYGYARDYMADWYRHIRLEASSTDAITNGALYLITGCDRPLNGALEWAFFPLQGTTSEDTDMKYLADSSRDVYLETTTNTLSNALGLELSNQVESVSVIVRGMKLALCPTSWPQTEVTRYPHRRLYYEILSTPVVGWRARLLKRRDRRFGAPTDRTIEEGVKIPFHPSDVICQIMLEKSPTARVAIVEDTVWMSAVSGEAFILPNIRKVLLRVFATHKLVTKDGIACLVPRSEEDDKNMSKNKTFMRLPFSEAFPGEHFVKKRLKAILRTRID